MATQRDRARVRAALGLLLEPVILLLLKSGVTWKEFAAVARERFVQVATREFGIRGRPTNASRVAILTGIDRRDVRKLRAALTDPGASEPGFMSKPTQVLEAWYRDPEFVGRDGKPKDLAVDGKGGFADLVRRYAAGIPVVAMIKELRAAGAVQKTRGNRLRVLKRTYIPRELSDDQIRLWSSALRDLGTTLEVNVMRAPDERPRFERRALSLAVDKAALPEFRAFLESEGQAFLERVDAWLESHRAAAQSSDSDAIRLGVGVFHIQDVRKDAPRTKQ
jgi:hypothetical protein